MSLSVSPESYAGQLAHAALPVDGTMSVAVTPARRRAATCDDNVGGVGERRDLGEVRDDDNLVVAGQRGPGVRPISPPPDRPRRVDL